MIVWKRLTYHFLACLAGGMMPPAASSAEPHKNSADIPALLQFAEQYNEKSYPAEPSPAVLDRTRSESQALSAAINYQKNLLMEAEKRDVVRQEQQAKLWSQRQLMQTELDETVKKLAVTRADMVSLQARSPRLVTADVLKCAQPREDYVAGISLGEEILQMQEEQQRWGFRS
ncbi:hypothetical protein RG489_003787 [Serratia marcescens]